MPQLTDPIDEAFAQAYVATGHQTRALVRIGVQPGNRGSSPMVKPEVKARIAELYEQHRPSQGRVLQELSRIAFADVRDLYDQHGNLLEPHEMSDAAAASISSIDVELTKDGTTVRKYRRVDKMAALGILAKFTKVVTTEDEGVNNLANALADRLKAARKRELGDVEDAQIVEPQALPQPQQADPEPLW